MSCKVMTFEWWLLDDEWWDINHSPSKQGLIVQHLNASLKNIYIYIYNWKII